MKYYLIRKAYEATQARCHTSHHPPGAAITVRMRSATSPGQVSLNHGQLFRLCYASTVQRSLHMSKLFFCRLLTKDCEIFALHDILFNHPIAETYFSGSRGEWMGDGRGSYKLRMPLPLPSQQETLTWRDWGLLIKMAAIYLAAGSLLRKRYRSLS